MARYYRRWRSRSNPNDAIWSLLFILIGVVILATGIQYWKLVVQWFTVLFAAIFVGLMSAAIYLKYRKWKKEQLLSLVEIDAMEGVALEHYLRGLLVSRELTDVKVTPKSKQLQSDFGIDLVGTHNGARYAIQAKRYKVGNWVGVEAVREAHTGATYYKCDKGMVITSGYFSNQAKELAKTAGVYLVDRDKLAEWIEEYQGKELGWREWLGLRKE